MVRDKIIFNTTNRYVIMTTPDFVSQIEEIQQRLSAQAESTKSNWQDSVAQRYFEEYIDQYDKSIRAFIHGDGSGMGLKELLSFIEQKTQELSAITGSSNG